MFMKEKDKQKNVKKKGRKERKEKEREEEKKKRKKKRRRDSPNPGGSALSHFEGGFPKVLREWILGFGGIKKEFKGGASVNPTGMNVVRFTHFFCACLCL